MNLKYIITDGSNYITYVKTGITVCGNIKTAYKFEKEKADNVMKSIPKTMKKFNWKVIEYTEDKKQEIETSVDMKKFDGLTDHILERMMDWEGYIKQLKEYMAVF
jgi:hypothetical protein